MLQFRHTDNINIFFKFVQSVDLPEVSLEMAALAWSLLTRVAT